jgi:alkanesulfonate monooxygenase SsuD/methylene tetrahydromethanopterin reductase-like flavin-dependent oxidoreductase (luciferase family)
VRLLLDFSLSLDNRLFAFEPERGFSKLLELAELVDESPLEAVWVNDSLIDTPGFEPLVTLGAVAARTKRVRIGTAILQPHFRNPVVLALAWATLDRAAVGRTILGLAIGGGTFENIRAECAEVGIEPRERGRILEATIEELRALFAGTHPRVSLPVRPVQRKVPIWIAAGIYAPAEASAGAQGLAQSGERGRYLHGRLDRVARLADGWLTLMATPSDIRESLALLAEKAAECGRRVDEITPCLELWVNVGPNANRCYRELKSTVERYFEGAHIPDETVERWAIWGEPEACRERLARFADAGLGHVKLVIGAPDPVSQFDRIVDAVVLQ